MVPPSKEERDSSKPNHNEQNAYGRISGITFELLGLNGIIIGGGYYLNELVATKIPWILLLAIFVSMAATIYYLIKKFVN